jgi:hypothetical protein
MRTYLPWDTATLSFQFQNLAGQLVQADGDVTLNVWEDGRTTVLLTDGVCTLVVWDNNNNIQPHNETYTYQYELFIPKETPTGNYPTTVTATINGVVTKQMSVLEIWGAYVTIDELKNSKTGFDFSTYSNEQLTYASLFAKEIIESYCDRQRWKHKYVQKGETVVDNLWRIYIRFRAKPVERVTYMKVRVPASTGIELTPSYLDLFSDQWYGYYPISTAYWASAVGTYPLIVLGHMDKLLYRVEYEADQNIPYIIKHASILICQNLLNADFYYNSLGIADVNGPVKEFKTGSYEVQFDTGWTYTGKGYQGGTFLTPDVQELLDRFKVMKNNSF